MSVGVGVIVGVPTTPGVSVAPAVGTAVPAPGEVLVGVGVLYFPPPAPPPIGV